MGFREPADRLRPYAVTVAVCLIVGLIFGTLGLHWAVSAFLSETVGSRLLHLHVRLSGLVPDGVYDALQKILFVIGLVATLAACGLSLVVGIRALRLGVRRTGAIALLTVGPVVALLLAGGPYLMRARQVTMLEDLDRKYGDLLARMRDRLQSESYPAAMRSRVWRQYAEIKYEREGIAIEFPDESGALLTFVPTERDDRARQVYLEYSAPPRPPHGWTLQVLAVVGLFVAFGLLTPVRRPAPPIAVDGGGR